MPLEALAQRYGFSAEALPDFKPRYNLAPTQQAVVIVFSEGRSPKPVRMGWGFVPPWSTPPPDHPAMNRAGSSTRVALGDRSGGGAKEGDDEGLMNLRSETLLHRGGFKKVLQQARCLVPVDGFYEWKKEGGRKIPIRYTPQGGGFFALGGVYSLLKRPTGQALSTFAILTTEPNDLVKAVHDRMPVIIPKALEPNWLNPLTRPFDYMSCLAPYPSQGMQAYAVSPLLNSAKNDSPDLITPASE